eukprot:CAMPEP_0179975038 /NCGR_PEP_ID=MMETSP0983-20121128/38442_1 /TAXON_ID=483367 /ORGANISM="non described non described, Strain CCMP 2436" /LENGTH=144 /DNA_ID=CAMNT_0021891391 /DNA_START=643 /DNA_END=1077 /DNA_ORIENTATION=-
MSERFEALLGQAASPARSSTSDGRSSMTRGLRYCPPDITGLRSELPHRCSRADGLTLKKSPYVSVGWERQAQGTITARRPPGFTSEAIASSRPSGREGARGRHEKIQCLLCTFRPRSQIDRRRARRAWLGHGLARGWSMSASSS